MQFPAQRSAKKILAYGKKPIQPHISLEVVFGNLLVYWH
ncbi:hypothetical protein LPL9_1369 [Lacticaseibacillus paracasei]|nr:hypothetical protein LPL9_1369 [Lacticaseibacillus paracasei]EKQ03580.1 hypothetical protein LCA211_2798 [Lacticaseibacillus casei 21/1]EKQ07649.1 hypothetical protein LCACRF28_1750 [Lacticaseibacillus paracasei]EKQ10581.1 hypothetical protein LCAM36_3016 [Lacticaseibacillus paracasei]EKQ29483.1 hypothetical protein LCALPC37_1370 [Lacticaseibacillus paracasei]